MDGCACMLAVSLQKSSLAAWREFCRANNDDQMSYCCVSTEQTKRRLLTFYMPKLLLIGSLWLLVVSLSCWQEFKQLSDPTYDYQFDTGYAMVCLDQCRFTYAIHSWDELFVVDTNSTSFV